MRQYLLERQVSEEAIGNRERSAGVELRAPGLHDAAERHAAWTYALAVPTHQAQLEVLPICGVRLDTSLIQALDEVDATARRLRLVAGDEIGGAVRQAQSAVDALSQIGGRRDVAGVQTHRPSGTSL